MPGLRTVSPHSPGWTRRQYLYHSDWRRHRDEAQHQRVLKMAARLPAAREQARAAVDSMRRRRSGGDELLTWHGTVLAATG